VKPASANHVFRALADPTRRAIFEELTRQGEQTVHALTRYAGVSQPAVSKHLTVLKRASWYGIAARDAKLTIVRSPTLWRRWWTGFVTMAFFGATGLTVSRRFWKGWSDE
jgi:hypothetical protein